MQQFIYLEMHNGHSNYDPARPSKELWHRWFWRDRVRRIRATRRRRALAWVLQHWRTKEMANDCG